MIVKLLARYVHTKEAFVGVNLAMELEHLLHIFSVDNEVTRLSVVVLWHCERAVDLYLCTIYGS